ncbi:MAG: MaoC family dehydratase [Endozoicomonas sp.]
MNSKHEQLDAVTRTLEDLRELPSGSELGVSQWYTLDQSHIDQFAETTGDRQWIHVDVERARRESPFGGTIAHGYLTLSMLSVMVVGMNVFPSGVHQLYNYGMDKVRFLSPVKAGGRVRNRCTLLGLETRENGQIIMKTENILEVEDSGKPALSAVCLTMMLF